MITMLFLSIITLLFSYSVNALHLDLMTKASIAACTFMAQTSTEYLTRFKSGLTKDPQNRIVPISLRLNEILHGMEDFFFKCSDLERIVFEGIDLELTSKASASLVRHMGAEFESALDNLKVDFRTGASLSLMRGLPLNSIISAEVANINLVVSRNLKNILYHYLGEDNLQSIEMQGFERKSRGDAGVVAPLDSYVEYVGEGEKLSIQDEKLILDSAGDFITGIFQMSILSDSAHKHLQELDSKKKKPNLAIFERMIKYSSLHSLVHICTCFSQLDHLASFNYAQLSSQRKSLVEKVKASGSGTDISKISSLLSQAHALADPTKKMNELSVSARKQWDLQCKEFAGGIPEQVRFASSIDYVRNEKHPNDLNKRIFLAEYEPTGKVVSFVGLNSFPGNLQVQYAAPSNSLSGEWNVVRFKDDQGIEPALPTDLQKHDPQNIRYIAPGSLSIQSDESVRSLYLITKTEPIETAHVMITKIQLRTKDSIPTRTRDEACRSSWFPISHYPLLDSKIIWVCALVKIPPLSSHSSLASDSSSSFNSPEISFSDSPPPPPRPTSLPRSTKPSFILPDDMK